MSLIELHVPFKRQKKAEGDVTEIWSTRSPQGAITGLQMEEGAMRGPLGVETDPLQPAKKWESQFYNHNEMHSVNQLLEFGNGFFPQFSR